MDAIKTGGLIAQVRREKELTQKDLAERLHVSTQAVSKWERGLNCPDIALLEPLAEALELTVSELLSGQRGEEPHEELVRDSLRVGENQLRPKIKRWRGLFILTAALLLALVLWLGYGWLRDNTRLLPQRETVVTPVDVTDREQIMVKVLSGGDSGLYLYDVVLQDGLSRWYVQMELEVSGEVEQSWVLAEEGFEDLDCTYPRRHLLALGLKPEEYASNDRNGSLKYTLCLASSSTSSRVENIPHLTGGMVLDHAMREKAVVDPEEGAVLLVLSVQGLDGYWYPWGTSHTEDTAFLVFRLYCE